jgi:RNA polymerase sigma factor (sigma-70 family)
MSGSSTTSGSQKPPSTKASLLARLRKGKDPSAWRLFVELYTPVIYRFCLRRGLQDADAEEVTQAVMVKVFLSIGRFAYDPARGRFRNWLGVIAIREIFGYRERTERPGKGSGGDQTESLAEQVIGPEEGDWLEEFNTHVLATALERIRQEFDHTTWQAFDWTWMGNVEPRSAAMRLDKAVGWIYKAKFRVLKRLREEVEFLAEDAASLHRPR